MMVFEKVYRKERLPFRSSTKVLVVEIDQKPRQLQLHVSRGENAAVVKELEKASI
jgi:hypothetical protein